MVTAQIGGWLIVTTDIGTAVFLAGPGTQEAWVELGDVALSDAVAGRVHRFRKNNGTVITSEIPIALWINNASGFGMNMVCEMDRRCYQKLLAAIQADMSVPDQYALLAQIAYISRWIPSFLPVINGG